MAIRIDDNALEARLRVLGENQMVRANKTRMAVSILERALALCDEAGDPEAWRAVLESNRAQPNGHTPASIRANAPTKSGPNGSVDRSCSASAGDTKPTTGHDSASPAGTRDPAISAKVLSDGEHSPPAV